MRTGAWSWILRKISMRSKRGDLSLNIQNIHTLKHAESCAGDIVPNGTRVVRSAEVVLVIRGMHLDRA
jgi:hypothetical protein